MKDAAQFSQEDFNEFIDFMTEYVSPLRQTAVSDLYLCVYRLDELRGGLIAYQASVKKFVELIGRNVRMMNWVDRLNDAATGLYSDNERLGLVLHDINSILRELALRLIAKEDWRPGMTDSYVANMGEYKAIIDYVGRKSVDSKLNQALVRAVKKMLDLFSPYDAKAFYRMLNNKTGICLEMSDHLRRELVKQIKENAYYAAQGVRSCGQDVSRYKEFLDLLPKILSPGLVKQLADDSKPAGRQVDESPASVAAVSVLENGGVKSAPAVDEPNEHGDHCIAHNNLRLT